MTDDNADDKMVPVTGDVEPANPRVDWSDFPDDLKRRAMTRYISGQYPDNEAIGRSVGAPPEKIAEWRAKNEPDNANWDELRRVRESGEWAVIPAPVVMTADQAADSIMSLQGQLLGMCHDALSLGTLVDERGEPVEYLWEEDTGRKVAINAMLRPEDIKDIDRIARLALMIEKQRDRAEEQRMFEAKVLSAMGEALQRLVAAIEPTERQQDDYIEELQRLQNQGLLPDGAFNEVKFGGTHVR